MAKTGLTGTPTRTRPTILDFEQDFLDANPKLTELEKLANWRVKPELEPEPAYLIRIFYLYFLTFL